MAIIALHAAGVIDYEVAFAEGLATLKQCVLKTTWPVIFIQQLAGRHVFINGG